MAYHDPPVTFTDFGPMPMVLPPIVASVPNNDFLTGTMAEILRLRKALQKIANIPTKPPRPIDHKKPDPLLRAHRIAIAALSAKTQEES